MAYSTKSTVISIGDLNVKRKFVNGRRNDLFHTCVSRNNLVSVRVRLIHSNLTLGVRGLPPITISGHLIPYVRNAVVKDDCQLLLSDHKPVICSILINDTLEQPFSRQEKCCYPSSKYFITMTDHFTKVFSDSTEANFENSFKISLEGNISVLKVKEKFEISPSLVSKICLLHLAE